MKKWNLFGVAALISAVSFFACEQEEVVQPELSALNTSENFSSYPGTTQTSWSNYTDLTKEWWRYVYSFDCARNPLNFKEINSPSIQPGNVVFLVGSKDGSALRNLTVSQTQLLVVPVLSTISKYPCEGLYSVKDSIYNYLLQDESDKFIDQVTNIKVVLDGAQVKVSHSNRYPTNTFAIRGNPDLAKCIDECVTGETQNAVSDGYWLFIRGLKKGKHELTVHAEVLQNGIVVDVKYIINVI